MQRQILLTLRQHAHTRVPLRITRAQSDAAKPEIIVNPSTAQRDLGFLKGFFIGSLITGAIGYIFFSDASSQSKQESDKVADLRDRLHSKSADWDAVVRRNEQLTSQVRSLTQENAEIKTQIDDLHARVVRKPS